MDSQAELREGMAVFDVTGRRLGYVEALRDGHFFLTHRHLMVKERIVVEAAASVAFVDAEGVHLRAGGRDLLQRQMRPRDVQSSRQVPPGADVSGVHRGDEDRRQLDSDDVREQRKDPDGPSPMNSGL